MATMINYGIDLGTTNSAIAKFVKGEVQVYNNPSDYGRNTLPSVVAFRKDKIFIGTNARTYYEKDAKSVAALFKRKMGTSESYKIRSINESKTPIELSALILKELKTFIPQEEQITSAVITVPASFDIIQSNATKEAGMQAGFKQIVLLQEPIAASLAWANMKKETAVTNGQWLVYDLGGGTFDVALLRIRDEEMQVVDHEGDNFLGGADFDNLIVEKILIPRLNENYVFQELEKELKSASGKHNAAYYVLLKRAEEAKIELSARSSAEIIIDNLIDDEGEMVDLEITITRSEFNALIRPFIDNTVEMVKTILTRNSLLAGDIQFILMVGGSTYIPFVRQYVAEALRIATNCNIDPSTAVAVGAAHYAATKPVQVITEAVEHTARRVGVKAYWQKASKEKEELFSAKISGDFADMNYRIVREDKGFDTGIKKLTERINEELPLVDNMYNVFRFTIYDNHGNIVESDVDVFGINSGFVISGQPLPEDICVEIDDLENSGETKLLLVFKKNNILPLKKTVTRTLNKTIIKGSEELVRINVLAGPEYALPSGNKSIGYIEISGKNLSRDAARGSDVELTFSMSESQDLTVAAYFTMVDQEFKQTFNPKERNIPVRALRSEIADLSSKLDSEIGEASANENFESAKVLSTLVKDAEKMTADVHNLSDDDVTDKRYQLEDRKRKLAQAIDNATKDKKLAEMKALYYEAKKKCEEVINDNGNDHERKNFRDIVSQEEVFLNSFSVARIREREEALQSIYIGILWRTPDFLILMFENLSRRTISMNDQAQSRSLLEAGKSAIENENWSRLREINSGLINLLPQSAQKEMKFRIGF